MNESAKLLFLGLPNAGKTTFFVALDEVLQRQKGNNCLKSAGFAQNRTYIDNAKKAWRAGKCVDHTPVNTEETVELLVANPTSQQTVSIEAPDVSGEFFEFQWADRQMPLDYKELLPQLAGAFLFINATAASRNPEMTAGWKKLPPMPGAMKKTWEPRFAAMQVKLVDMLQVTSQISGIRPFRLAIILSAWDMVDNFENPTVSPMEFLTTEWPLLDQYLTANPDSFTSKLFGVSARGGDDAAQAHLKAKKPHERVWLNDGSGPTRDLTQPLRWLMNW